MWNEVCQQLCARSGGSCSVALVGAEESAAAFFTAAAGQAGCVQEGGKAVFPCAEGSFTLVRNGAPEADAVLYAAASAIGAEQAAAAMAAAEGKPFVLLVTGADAAEACERLSAVCDVPAVACDLAQAEDLSAPLRELLFSFPAAGVDIDLPDWMSVLPQESRVVAAVLEKVREVAPKIVRVRDFPLLAAAFTEEVYCASLEADPVTGTARCTLAAREGLFHRVLSEECGADVSDDLHLMAYIGTLREAKKFYDVFKNAVAAADAVGYGIAAGEAEAALGAPELFRRGNRCGVRLKADAPAYHIIKVDVHSEVTPVSGEGERGEQLAKGMLESYERDPDALWGTDMFGKTFRQMVQESLRERQGGVPDEVRAKLRRALTRIVNEGKGGVVCILL